jgi:glutamate-1-semialdehyde 2,1-aminomutase
VDSGKGNTLLSADGHTYLDLVGDMTAGLFGHSHPLIQSTLIATISSTGLNLGATTAAESQFAAIIKSRIPSIEQLRFCNSGTEGNLYNISIAKMVTGRPKVVVFNGAYHGGVLTFAHGPAANNVDRQEWVLGTYNDAEGVRKLVREGKGEIAAVLVEGMMGSGGCVAGTREFLHAIGDVCKEASSEAALSSF